jgi:ribosomal-protein-alanine N-acetyltransferase
MNGYSIERARPQHLAAIMELEHSGFHAGIRESEAVFRARMDTFPEGFVVLAKKKSVVGYLCSERWAEAPPADAKHYALGHDPAPRHDPSGAALYLASITVDPALRGSGLGAWLFNEGIRRIHVAAPGLRDEMLIVNEEWTGAKRIYETAGFSMAGAIPGFFASASGASSAAVIMSRAAGSRGLG